MVPLFMTPLEPSEVDADEPQDELMDSMKRVLHPEPRKLLPPPDTARVGKSLATGQSTSG